MQFPPSEPKPKLPKLKDILEQLESGDVQLQSVALRAFSILVEKTQKALNSNEVDRLVDFLEIELKKPDSSLHTDLFKTAAIIAEKIHPKYIHRLFPIMMDELDTGNRFRSKIIINMFAKIASNADSNTQPFIFALISKTPDLISNTHMQPILEQFFSEIVQNDVRNFYKDKINEALHRFPADKEEFIAPLKDRLFKIEKSLESLRKKRREDLVKKREKAKIIRETDSIIVSRQIADSEDSKVKKKAKIDIERQKQEILDTLIENQTVQHPTNEKEDTEEPEENDIEEEKIESEECESTDESTSEADKGVSFSSLGLKRKKQSKSQ